VCNEGVCRTTFAHSTGGVRIIVLDEQHLTSVLTEFVRYYNRDRPHRTLGLQTPEASSRPVTGPIRSRPVLNGLHHTYERAA
jgi:putative transposase